MFSIYFNFCIFEFSGPDSGLKIKFFSGSKEPGFWKPGPKISGPRPASIWQKHLKTIFLRWDHAGSERYASRCENSEKLHSRNLYPRKREHSDSVNIPA